MSDKDATDWRRILVALDAERHNPEILQLALRLAEARQAELMALLVESEQLAQLASLPFAHEVHRLFATVQRLDSAHLTRLKQRQLQQISRVLQRESLSKGMRASVQAATALRLNELLQTAQETDLALLATSRTVQFALKYSASTTRPKQVWVLLDGSAQAKRALQVGVELCCLEPYRLVRVQRSQSPSADLDQAAAAELRVLPDISLPALQKALREQKDLALLIVPSSFPLLQAELMGTLSCPILLVH